MIPFDNYITTRLAAKDQFRPCIPKPIDSSVILPAPAPRDTGSNFEGLDAGALSDINASLARAYTNYPRGEDVLPAPPSKLLNGQAAPVNPPSVALGPYGIAAQQ